MYAKKLIDFKSTLTRKTGFNPMTQVIGRFFVSSVIISVLILWMAFPVLAQNDPTSYPTFNQGKWKIELLFTPKFTEDKLKSIDFNLKSNLHLNFNLSEKLKFKSESLFDLMGLKKQKVISQLNLADLNSVLSSRALFDPNLRKIILGFTTHQIERVKLSSFLLLFFERATDSIQTLSYKPGIVVEGV